MRRWRSRQDFFVNYEGLCLPLLYGGLSLKNFRNGNFKYVGGDINTIKEFFMNKKLLFSTMLVILFAFILVPRVFAQQSIYVSMNGNDDYDGLSETNAKKSFRVALNEARIKSIKTITVIGTINVNNDDRFSPIIINNWGTVFLINDSRLDITITGKHGATGAERAILTGRGAAGAGVITITENAKVRFEHIEISGGDQGNTGRGNGINIHGNASVTLGTGAVVGGNDNLGINVGDNNIFGIAKEGTLIIDGGIVRDNRETGVAINEGGTVNMNSGEIKNNRSYMHGGGVGISNGGRFTMSGGTITGNSANARDGAGGGVCVLSGGRFEQTGGTISNNTAGRGSNPNIFRAQGALGNNL